MATRLKAADDGLATLFSATRALTLELAEPLSDADATVQSMDDASPAKWHLAHTTWFFETFILRDNVAGYVPFDPAYHFLFNSYYEAEGDRHARPQRGMITRPSLDEIRAYRAHVDAALVNALPSLSNDVRDLVELGCNHETQHQELLLTDILHLFAQNPTAPAYRPEVPQKRPVSGPMQWIEGKAGLVEIGHDGDDFAFDCERPRHQSFLAPHALADRLVTNADWQGFVDDGGYTKPQYWLSSGWTWVVSEGISAPSYWRGDSEFSLNGLVPREPHAPVRHVSHYEADAFARWAGARLPTEAEWESAAQGIDHCSGNQLDSIHALPRKDDDAVTLRQMFGDVWQWTSSAFLPHPGFAIADGAVGEYNGKFMSGQMVLKGASSATPRGSSRASTRNFFPATARWQYSGLRLARDA